MSVSLTTMYRTANRVALIVAALMCLVATSAQAQKTAAQGWAELWNNDLSRARATFLGVLEENDEDLAALRGLVLADFATGYERHAIEVLEEIADHEDAGFEDYLLTVLFYSSSATCGKDEKRFASILKEIAERDGVAYLDRRPILAARASHAIAGGEADEVRDIADKLNRVREWSLMGMFDNVAGGGHDRDYLGFPGTKLSQYRRGKAGVKVNWFEPEVIDPDAILDFGNYFERASRATGYAGFKLTVKEPTEVLLSISQGGALEVEIDGLVVLSIDDVQNQLEVNQLRVALEQGVHTVIFKLSGRETSPDLAVGVSALDGEEPDGVQVDRLVPVEGVQPTATSSATRVELPSVVRLREAWEAEPNDPAAAFWYQLALWVIDTRELARAVADDLVEEHGDSALHLFLAAQAASDVEDSDEYRARIRRSYEIAPGFSAGLLFEAGRLAAEESFARLDSLLESAAARNGEFITAYYALLGSYGAQGLTDKAITLAQRLTEIHPDFSEPYRVLAEHAEAMGDTRRARRMYSKVRDRSSKTRATIVDLLKAASKEDYEDISDHLDKLRKLTPSDPYILIALANARLQSGQVEDGVELARKISLWFPYIASAQLFNGELEYMRSPYEPSRKPIAIGQFESALRLNPGDFDTRDKLRKLKGKPPVSDMLPRIDLESVRSGKVEPESYPGEGAYVLLDDMRRIRFPDGSSYMENIIVAQILTESGVDRFGSLRLGVNPLFSDVNVKVARTVKPNGAMLEAEELLGAVAFKGLEPGDVVELHFGVNSWNMGSLNQEFWDDHLFRWDVPCAVSRYTILLPAGSDVRTKIHNYLGDTDALVTRVVEGDYTRFTWKMENLTATPNEPFAAPWRDRAPWLDISTIDSWARVVSWYLDLASAPSEADPVVAAKTRDILNGVTDPRARVDAIYRFVCNDIAYEDLWFQYSGYVPERARDVLAARYGDCKDKVGLMRSMLASVGIESYFVLVSPANEGMQGFLPSPRFKHAVIGVDLEGGGDPSTFWYLDPTARWMPPGRLPSALWGAPALVVKKGVAALRPLPETPWSGIAAAPRAAGDGGGPGGPLHKGCIKTRVTLANGEDLVVKRRECVHDAEMVASLRARFAGKTESERRDYLTRSLNVDAIGVELESCDWMGLDNHSLDSLVQHYEFIVRRGANLQSDVMIIKLPWDTGLSTIYGPAASMRTRSTPMATYNYRLLEDEALTVDIPAGWTVVSVPDDVDVASDAGHYRCEFDLEGRKLRAWRSVRVRPALIPPQEYPKFNRIVETGVHNDDAVLVLKKQ